MVQRSNGLPPRVFGEFLLPNCYRDSRQCFQCGRPIRALIEGLPDSRERLGLLVGEVETPAKPQQPKEILRIVR